MNNKVLLGIVLPSVLIITLILLSASNIGLSVVREPVNSLRFYSLFVYSRGEQEKNTIPLETLTVTNNFFLARTYTLPDIVVCLSGEKGTKRIYTGIEYEGVSYENGGTPVFDEINDIYDYHTEVIDLPAYSKKEIRVSTKPVYLYEYGRTLESYKAYNKSLVIIETNGENGEYTENCKELMSKYKNHIVYIPLIPH